MKAKLLLKFYFDADRLNKWLDRLIEHRACKIGEDNFDSITALIDDKAGLCSLMRYLEGRFERLTDRDITALKKYAFLRVGIRNLEGGIRREIKRAVMKFVRRLTFFERYSAEVGVLKKYRAIVMGAGR